MERKVYRNIFVLWIVLHKVECTLGSCAKYGSCCVGQNDGCSTSGPTMSDAQATSTFSLHFFQLQFHNFMSKTSNFFLISECFCDLTCLNVKDCCADYNSHCFNAGNVFVCSTIAKTQRWQVTVLRLDSFIQISHYLSIVTSL